MRPLPFSLRMYEEDYFHILNGCPFDNKAYAVSGEVGF